MSFENNFDQNKVNLEELKGLREKTVEKHQDLLKELKSKGLSEEEGEKFIKIGLLKWTSERFGKDSEEFKGYLEKI